MKKALLLTLLFRAIGDCFSAGTSIAVQIHPGDLIVADSHTLNLPGGALVDINPLTGAQTLISSGGFFTEPAGVCFDRGGNIIVADFGYTGSGSIIRVNPATGQQTVLSTGGSLSHPTSIALDSQGNIIVAQEGPIAGPSAVLKIDPVTGAQTVVASGQPLNALTGIAIDSSGNYLVCDFQNNSHGGSSIVNVDAMSGAKSVITSAGYLQNGPEGVAMNYLESNSLLVAEETAAQPATNAILKVDTVTGTQSLISLGGLLTSPAGIAQDLLGNIFVSDQNSGNGRILEINPTTGAQTIISSGGFLQTPDDLVVAVSEPASYVLMLIAGGTLFGWRRLSSRSLRSKSPNVRGKM